MELFRGYFGDVVLSNLSSGVRSIDETCIRNHYGDAQGVPHRWNEDNGRDQDEMEDDGSADEAGNLGPERRSVHLEFFKQPACILKLQHSSL